MRKQRKQCTAKEQVVILRRHFLEKRRHFLEKAFTCQWRLAELRPTDRLASLSSAPV